MKKFSGIKVGGILLTLIGAVATAIADYVQQKKIEDDMKTYIDKQLSKNEGES